MWLDLSRTLKKDWQLPGDPEVRAQVISLQSLVTRVLASDTNSLPAGVVVESRVVYLKQDQHYIGADEDGNLYLTREPGQPADAIFFAEDVQKLALAISKALTNG